MTVSVSLRSCFAPWRIFWQPDAPIPIGFVRIVQAAESLLSSLEEDIADLADTHGNWRPSLVLGGIWRKKSRIFGNRNDPRV